MCFLQVHCSPGVCGLVIGLWLHWLMCAFGMGALMCQIMGPAGGPQRIHLKLCRDGHSALRYRLLLSPHRACTQTNVPTHFATHKSDWQSMLSAKLSLTLWYPVSRSLSFCFIHKWWETHTNSHIRGSCHMWGDITPVTMLGAQHSRLWQIR